MVVPHRIPFSPFNYVTFKFCARNRGNQAGGLSCCKQQYLDIIHNETHSCFTFRAVNKATKYYYGIDQAKV